MIWKPWIAKKVLGVFLGGLSPSERDLRGTLILELDILAHFEEIS